MDLKTRGMVLKGVASGDKDVIITIFCVNYGIIRAKLRGVKTEKAKLKFAKEQFCFADFVLAEKNGFFTVTQVDVIDTFYSLTTNYEAFLTASKILKIVLSVALENQANDQLFLNVLKSVKALAYDNAHAPVVMIKFLLGLFFSEGYHASNTTCSGCGQKLGRDSYLDFDSGEILCFSCKTPFAQRVSFEVGSVLRVVSNTEFENLQHLNLDAFLVENALLLLERTYEKKF